MLLENSLITKIYVSCDGSKSYGKDDDDEIIDFIDGSLSNIEIITKYNPKN
jgi:uncharacterized protein (DUF169 family)